MVGERTNDGHIKNLGQKMAVGRPEADPVVPIYGVGYRLDPP